MKRAKIVIELKSDEIVSANIQGRGQDIINLLVHVMDDSEEFSKMVSNALMIHTVHALDEALKDVKLDMSKPKQVD